MKRARLNQLWKYYAISPLRYRLAQDKHLKLKFEAIRQFDEEDKQIAQGVLEGLILKHQAKQSVMRQSKKGKR